MLLIFEIKDNSNPVFIVTLYTVIYFKLRSPPKKSYHRHHVKKISKEIVWKPRV
jgi:hypothetical protein